MKYCTRCGALLEMGRCEVHGLVAESVEEPVAEPEAAAESVATTVPPAPKKRVLPAILVCVLVVAVGSAVAIGVMARRDAQASQDEVRRLREALAATSSDAKKQAAASLSATRDLSVRIGTLEARAHNTADPAVIAKSAQPSVFTIEAGDALGSAWVASSSGSHSLLVTNFHVIADEHVNGRSAVRLRRGDRTYDATITSTSAVDDLALISVPERLPKLPIKAAEPQPGDSVVVIGSPLGLGGTVSTGIVSALRTEDGVRYLQFTAPISPGNSGGPVLDRTGKVVGVSVAKIFAEGAEGLSFAIPARRICDDFDVC